MSDPSEYKKPIVIEVCVSVTMHKTVKVPIDNYEETYLGNDEDGDPIIERKIENDVLADSVERNCELPFQKFKDWTLDEFEVVEE